LEEIFINNIISITKLKNVKIIFEIASKNEQKQAELLISNYNIKNYEFKPFYNGKNIVFFENNVFLSKNDIFSTIVSQRKIFAHQKLNTNFFGQIHIYPNGDIKAHPSKDDIGNCKKEHIVYIIEKELIKNTAWRVIRNDPPCCNCLYQFLCPSISGYEWVINKNNLCKIT